MLRIVAREVTGADDTVEVPLHECDPCALDRDVRTGAHRDAGIGGGKGRGVVDAVTGHRNAPPRHVRLVDQCLFPFRQHPRTHLIDTESRSDRLGRARVVARGHNESCSRPGVSASGSRVIAQTGSRTVAAADESRRGEPLGS